MRASTVFNKGSSNFHLNYIPQQHFVNFMMTFIFPQDISYIFLFKSTYSVFPKAWSPGAGCGMNSNSNHTVVSSICKKNISASKTF